MLSQSPRAQTDVQSTSFVWQRAQNPKYSSFNFIYDQKNSKFPHLWGWNQQRFDILLEKWLKFN